MAQKTFLAVQKLPNGLEQPPAEVLQQARDIPVAQTKTSAPNTEVGVSQAVADVSPTPPFNAFSGILTLYISGAFFALLLFFLIYKKLRIKK